MSFPHSFNHPNYTLYTSCRFPVDSFLRKPTIEDSMNLFQFQVLCSIINNNVCQQLTYFVHDAIQGLNF